LQNLAPGGFAPPHALHAAASGVAHSLQKRAPSGFDSPQELQFTRVLYPESAPQLSGSPEGAVASTSNIYTAEQ
jgi:hypothetical protein